MVASSSAAEKKPGWLASLKFYGRREVRPMLFLGFAAGMPLLLVFSTLTAWLRDVGIERATIGYFAWVTITYSFKFVWSPIVDRVPIPGLTAALGRRRSWMLAAQIGIIVGLLAMAVTGPSGPGGDLTLFALLALLVAFCSATQDIALDAYRIESAPAEMQGYLAGAYQFGYRIATLAAGAGSLFIAAGVSWPAAYAVMAVTMLVGVATVLVVAEPKVDETGLVARERELNAILGPLAANATPWAKVVRWFWGAVLSPFIDFFQRCGWYALLILAFVSLFRFSDQIIGPMANPFYLDLGFSKEEIAEVSKLYGFVMTVIGFAVGGLAVARFNLHWLLLVSAIAIAASNLLFWWLDGVGHDLFSLGVVISAENFASGFAGTVFIAYLSGLTSAAYTATQYALFSSLMTLPGKVTSTFSGEMVDAWGYDDLFLLSAAAGIPAIILVLVLKAVGGGMRERLQPSPAAPAK